LQQSDGEYAALVSDVIAPQVLKSLALAAAPGGGSSLEQSGSLGTLLGILTVLPLTSADLASRLSDDQARRLVDRWETLRQEARGDATQLYVDLVLRSGYGRLGLEAERQQVVRRLNENPARAELFPKGVDDQAVDVLLSVVCQSLNELQKAAARLRELGIDMNRLP
jgi:rhodanese-related sulfurtransferase